MENLARLNRLFLYRNCTEDVLQQFDGEQDAVFRALVDASTHAGDLATAVVHQTIQIKRVLDARRRCLARLVAVRRATHTILPPQMGIIVHRYLCDG